MGYPPHIRKWIAASGGLPYEGFIELKASELWKMGYRKCPDNGGADEDVVLGSPPGMPSRVMPDPEGGGSPAGMLDYIRAQSE